MKNVKKIITIISLLFSGHLYASTITWGGASTNVNVNDSFTVDIIGTGFTSNVDGGGVNFAFNSSVLNVTSISINESVWNLGAGINTGTIDNASGVVTGISVNAWDDVFGDFTMASVTFQAIGSGVSSLIMGEWGTNPWASGGSLLNPDFGAGSVTVAETPISAVPVPAAIWLFGSGLISLIGFSKRKK
jgi:hypothetical protein